MDLKSKLLRQIKGLGYDEECHPNSIWYRRYLRVNLLLHPELIVLIKLFDYPLYAVFHSWQEDPNNLEVLTDHIAHLKEWIESIPDES